jgi:hypothetical protein
MTRIADGGALQTVEPDSGPSGDGVGRPLDIDEGIAVSVGDVAWAAQLPTAELVALAEEAQKVGSICARRVAWLKRDISRRAKASENLAIASYVTAAVTAALLAGAQLIKSDPTRADATAVVGGVGAATTTVLVGLATAASDNENIQQLARRVGEIEGAADSFRQSWQRRLDDSACPCLPDGGAPKAGSTVSSPTNSRVPAGQPAPETLTCELREWDDLPHGYDCTTYAKVMPNNDLVWVTESRFDHYVPYTKGSGLQCRLGAYAALKLKQNLWSELQALRGVCDRAPIFVVGNGPSSATTGPSRGK